ncbi:hypothetical protein [Pseudomonas cremoricolorata]|uniref:Uncharacterized protein n=1 Tax=Pseudomonas cremoricolorata TaxID=157783 RepID=A0A089WXV2_9PSED|nr:hypothetical protein [Pseudomonas cremoricolorata]AIR91472.1 hypothetical protein LK03_20335 [Pseudomonas cremoricolorata]
MQLNTTQFLATPCDDEEDDMATLCCISDKGQMFLLTRYPDEDTVDLTLDDEPSTLDGLKVTLGATHLVIEVAPGDRDALKGDAQLHITHATPASDLPEVLLTLRNLLDGTGELISEV